MRLIPQHPEKSVYRIFIEQYLLPVELQAPFEARAKTTNVINRFYKMESTLEKPRNTKTSKCYHAEVDKLIKCNIWQHIGVLDEELLEKLNNSFCAISFWFG